MAGIALGTTGNSSQPGNGSSELVKNMCAIVEARDKIIKETDIRIEYHKNALERILAIIKNLEKERKIIADKNEFLQKQNDQLEFIKNSLEGSREVVRQSLINHQYFEEIVTKELEAKEKGKKRIERECRNLYSEAQEQLTENPLYKELQKQKMEFLKLDIKKRDLEVKIRQKKKVTAQKNEIERKKFYNFFIEMAQDYLIKKRLKELEKLRTEELEAVKRLFAVQEKVKIQQKLGTPRDIKRMTNITFGTQECRIENSQSKIEPPQPRKDTKLFNEKLNNMFQQDEPKNLTLPKVQILNQKIITPAFVAPNFAPPEKRKHTTVDLSRKWQKLMKSSTFSKDCVSQESQKLSEASQQSQLSQPEQLALSPAVVQEQPISSGESTQGRNISSSQISYTSPNMTAPQHEMVPKTPVSEHGKSVRFNLEQISHQTESKSIFGGQSIFGNMFNPFSNRVPMQNEILLQNQTTGANNTFNASLPVCENSNIGLDVNSGENETRIRSPEYSYELEGGGQNRFKAPEMPAFGGGGFFSFGKNMFNPF